mmetsp:Transcript_20970/g.53127  ORF Transcript_20970/g.53127 Transcript_20970/m.53127 type:complete len:304 (-) Transcript_20970:3051-3962(-)
MRFARIFLRSVMCATSLSHPTAVFFRRTTCVQTTSDQERRWILSVDRPIHDHIRPPTISLSLDRSGTESPSHSVDHATPTSVASPTVVTEPLHAPSLDPSIDRFSSDQIMSSYRRRLHHHRRSRRHCLVRVFRSDAAASSCSSLSCSSSLSSIGVGSSDSVSSIGSNSSISTRAAAAAERHHLRSPTPPSQTERAAPASAASLTPPPPTLLPTTRSCNHHRTTIEPPQPPPPHQATTHHTTPTDSQESTATSPARSIDPHSAIRSLTYEASQPTTRHRYKHSCRNTPEQRPKVQCAFKDLMIH